MPSQTQKGKAFEYACLKALKENLLDRQSISIEENTAFQTAYGFYCELDQKTILKMNKAAQAACRIILRLEPQLENADHNNPLFLSIQEDAKGITGDVRDVLCIRNQNQWEIGLSCKHNHTAVKHSRLSYTIDFGLQWFNKSCSKAYFEEIKPLFTELNLLRERGLKWSEVFDKENKVYVTLLNAFVSELKRLDVEFEQQIPSALLSYLLGKNDFYKVITKDSKKLTQIQAYNIFGTLNRNASKVKPEIKVQQLKLPTKFFDISYKSNSKNTIIVTCNNGWALSFRIHNASTYVEPSLKFDIQLIGVPEALHSQVEPW